MVRALETAGHRVTLRPTNAPQHATELAVACVGGCADLILAAGGDGTINEVVNGMVGSEIPLAILPVGTANVLAMEMGIGRNPVKVAAAIGDMVPKRISLGLARNPDGTPRRYFLTMAGAGLDAHIVANLDPKMKHALGKGSYYLAGFQSLGRKLEELEVEANGKRTRCSFALTSNVRNYGGDLEIALGASLLKNQFESVLFAGASPITYLRYFFGVLTRTADKINGVTFMPTQALQLSPVNGDAVRLQLDGEDAGLLPVRLENVPHSLTLLMPPAFVQKEQERAQWTTSPTR
jgi:diacylglycerol kinase (ATP)